MPSSPIRKLVPYAETAKKNGTHVYHLNIGQPDIETPGVVLNELKNMDRKVIEYSHSAGFLSYRNGLADYYKNIGFIKTREPIDWKTEGFPASPVSWLPESLAAISRWKGTGAEWMDMRMRERGYM